MACAESGEVLPLTLAPDGAEAKRRRHRVNRDPNPLRIGESDAYLGLALRCPGDERQALIGGADDDRGAHRHLGLALLGHQNALGQFNQQVLPRAGLGEQGQPVDQIAAATADAKDERIDVDFDHDVVASQRQDAGLVRERRGHPCTFGSAARDPVAIR